jgi:hypothetical protein
MPHNTNRERNAEQIGSMKFPVSYGIIAPLGRLVGAGAAGAAVATYEAARAAKRGVRGFLWQRMLRLPR